MNTLSNLSKILVVILTKGSSHYFKQHTLQPIAKSFNESQTKFRIFLNQRVKEFQASCQERNGNRSTVEITKRGSDFQWHKIEN